MTVNTLDITLVPSGIAPVSCPVEPGAESRTSTSRKMFPRDMSYWKESDEEKSKYDFVSYRITISKHLYALRYYTMTSTVEMSVSFSNIHFSRGQSKIEIFLSDVEPKLSHDWLTARIDQKFHMPSLNLD